MEVLAPAVFDLVDRITAASTVDSVWDAYLGAAKNVGLGYGVACFLPPALDSPVQLVTDAMPENWLSEYYSERLDAGDLLVERARGAIKSFQWRLSDWDIAAMTPGQLQWRDHNLRHGILGGLAVLDFQPGENMLLVVCGPDGDLEDHDCMALYFSGQQAILRLREMVHSGYVPLSRRERECLQWAAAGKTDWEIGQILSLSEKTVNVYIERAKTKFHVPSRAQAIVLAMRAGMLAA